MVKFGSQDATSMIVPLDPHSSSDVPRANLTKPNSHTTIALATCNLLAKGPEWISPSLWVIKQILWNTEGSSYWCCQMNHEIPERITRSMVYGAQPCFNNQLIACCDVDYARDMANSKPQSGYVLVLNGGPIDWGSCKQTCTAMQDHKGRVYCQPSSCLARNHLNASITTQLEICIDPTMLYNDNWASIRLVRNPKFHWCTKHVDMKNHKIHEAESNGEILITYINTMGKIKNVLMKALPWEKFGHMKSTLPP